jgi:flagellar protein FlaG
MLSGDSIVNISSISSGGKAAPNMTIANEERQAIAVPMTSDIRASEVQTVDAVQQAGAIPSADQIKQAVQDINQSLQSAAQGLEFSIDTDSKEVIIKVIDQETREVLRQMPSKEALDIARALDQALGKLIKTKA